MPAGALLLGCLLVPTTAVARPEGRESNRRGDAYVLSRDGRWLSTNVSLEEVHPVQKRFPGAFLWTRRAGSEYLIRDGRILEEAQSLFSPLAALDPERTALQRRQSQLEAEEAAADRAQDDIESELDRLDDDDPERGDDADQEALESRRRELEAQIRDLEVRERELDAVERSIDAREDEIERAAEAKLWKLIDRTIVRGAAQTLERP